MVQCHQRRQKQTALDGASNANSIGAGGQQCGSASAAPVAPATLALPTTLAAAKAGHGVAATLATPVAFEMPPVRHHI